MAADRFETYLAALRDRTPDMPAMPAGGEWFTVREVGDLLGGVTRHHTALLGATGGSADVLYGLAGSQRVTLYRTALATGFRAAELAALAPEHFDLDAQPPAVTLPPELTKNRKGALQPLPDELVADLRQFLSGRRAKQPLWPGRWRKKAAAMLRADLDAAGVPIEVDGPEETETRDFHALRACYISNVIRAGADLKQAMTQARHSDPRLTASRYARTRLGDLGAVVNKLPKGDTAAPALRQIGTEGGRPRMYLMAVADGDS